PITNNDSSTTAATAAVVPQNKDRRGIQLKRPVPRTPGLRHVRRPLNDHLWKGRPLFNLTFPKKGHGKGGRNFTGRVVVRHRGGGHKRRIRTVDFKRQEPGAHVVERIEHDPNRSGHIALIRNKKTGKQSYILAVEGLRAGHTVESYMQGIPPELIDSIGMGGRIDHGILASITARQGNCLPLTLVPVGSVICNIGLRPNGRGQLCRGAGTYGVLVSKEVPLPDRFDEIWQRVTDGELLIKNADGVIQLPALPETAGIANENENIKTQVNEEVEKQKEAQEEAVQQVQEESATAAPVDQTQPDTTQLLQQQNQESALSTAPEPNSEVPASAPAPSAPEEAASAQSAVENALADAKEEKRELKDGESKVTIQDLREMRRRSQNAVIRLSSGEIRYIHMNCCATIGKVSNPDYKYRQVGKAGRSRWLGIRPTVRGLAMNAKDHPHGGGRGKSKGNVHPKSPWGMPAKSGYRTRPKWKVNKAVLVPRVRNQGKRRRGYH
ncbi:hypothetical protein KEM56_001403, partial [Ascosphaera pollenicola]